MLLGGSFDGRLWRQAYFRARTEGQEILSRRFGWVAVMVVTGECEEKGQLDTLVIFEILQKPCHLAVNFLSGQLYS